MSNVLIPSTSDLLELWDPVALKEIVEEVLSAMPRGWGEPEWYCPKCESFLSGGQVKNDGTHWKCGTQLEGAWIDDRSCPKLMAYAKLKVKTGETVAVQKAAEGTRSIEEDAQQ